MKKLTNFLSYSAIISLILLIILGIMFLWNNQEIYQNIASYTSVPFAAVLSYIIFCSAFFGAQLLKSNPDTGARAVIYISIIASSTLGLGIVIIILNGYLGILNPDIFYDTIKNGRIHLNTNFRLLWLTIGLLALIVNFSLKEKNFIKKLPFFHD